jgi:hypothetical protein
MQQLPIAQWQHKDSHDDQSLSMAQRLAQWGKIVFAIQPSNAEKFDDCDLDQRVRLSGEW